MLAPKMQRICCTREQFNILKKDDHFPIILSLARAVNALRYCLHTFASETKQNSLLMESNSNNAFLYMCGVLYEGLDTLRVKSRDLHNLKSYKEQAKPFKKETQMFFETVLHEIRNQIVFHYDSDCFKNTLGKLDFKECDFAISDGSFGNTYYCLADIVAINYISQLNKNEKTEIDNFRELFDQVVSFSKEFIEVSEEIIIEKLKIWDGLYQIFLNEKPPRHRAGGV